MRPAGGSGRFSLPVLCIALFLSFFCSGCGDKPAAIPSGQDSQQEDGRALRDSTPVVPTPEATGEQTDGTEGILLDYSNETAGYVILTYTGSNQKVKLQIQMPDGVTCTYLVGKYKEPLAYPLSGGDGHYTLTVLESVDMKKDLYAVSFTKELEVSLENEFVPFLTPNCYVSFHPGSSCVKKGQELSEKCTSDLDVVSNIYNYVIKNISYDTKKAENVSYGYTPDPDQTLSSGKGICFDYASLMTAMLRSQRIPTRLEVGYSAEVYHAWISCYVDEIGWVDNVIQFDGKSWSLMDPTLAAENDPSSVRDYIGDGSNYVVKYTY